MRGHRKLHDRLGRATGRANRRKIAPRKKSPEKIDDHLMSSWRRVASGEALAAQVGITVVCWAAILSIFSSLLAFTFDCAHADDKPGLCKSVQQVTTCQAAYRMSQAATAARLAAARTAARRCSSATTTGWLPQNQSKLRHRLPQLRRLR